MKTEKESKSKIKRLSILCGIFAFILLIMILLRQSTSISVFLQNTLSRAVIWFSGHIFGWISFSLYELFLYIIGIVIIISIIKIIKRLIKKRFKKALTIVLSLVLTALAFCNIYFASAGFAYAQTISFAPAYQKEISKEELDAVCEYFLNDYNYLANKLKRDKDGKIVSPYTDKQLNKKLKEEYKRLNIKEINSYTPNCKPIISSRVMSEMHVAGVFFAPFGEANINRDMPPVQKPFTMAHEMAHSKGVMREDNADILAAYLTLTSEDEFIRYSGYIETIGVLFYSWVQYGQSNTHRYFLDSREESAIFDLMQIYEFWNEFHLLEDITQKFIDFQLRLMGQKEGSKAYNPPAETEVLPDIDENTGEQKVDEDGEPVYIYNPIFTDIQKLYLAIAIKE